MATHFFGLKDRTFYHSHSVGRNEFAGTGFRNPVDMAIASDGSVYVINRSYENRPDGVHMTVCTLDEEYISAFGEYGEGDGQFVWPTAVTLDADGNVYVTDEWLNRVTKFTPDGDYVSKWGVAGSGDGELNGPSGLAIDSHGHVVIVDSKNNRVQRFTLDGQFLGSFGSEGSGSGEFNLPWGIALDKNDNIYITDWRNDRVQVFSHDGEWQQSIGSTGSGIGQFNRPNGLCVDADGDIYVADWMNNRVQVFAPDGRFITQFVGDAVLSKWGKDKLNSNPDMIRQRNIAYSNDPTYEQKFAHPCGVRIDEQGRVAIIDHTRGRIQVYVKEDEPVLR